jgi:hypothetical protein
LPQKVFSLISLNKKLIKKFYLYNTEIVTNARNGKLRLNTISSSRSKREIEEEEKKITEQRSDNFNQNLKVFAAKQKRKKERKR